MLIDKSVPAAKKNINNTLHVPYQEGLISWSFVIPEDCARTTPQLSVG